ncbi:MAG: hypothetical protein GEV06_25920 [Luteitalea sp.]|nr:hypothetical protein [Luteitalea sp.]
MKALDDSFAFCDEVFASLTDANVMDFVKRGKGEIVKTALLVGLLAHGAEMYGVSTVYLRARNLVPLQPSGSRGVAAVANAGGRDAGSRRPRPGELVDHAVVRVNNLPLSAVQGRRWAMRRWCCGGGVVQGGGGVRGGGGAEGV